MQVTNWIEFIKNTLGDTQFKDVAACALRVIYGRSVRLNDGTGDGGIDAWMIWGETTRIPVQFHSGRSVAWYSKLEQDLQKPLVKDAGRIYFVTSQTPESIEIIRKKDELGKKHNVIVGDVVTAREIASCADDPKVFEALGKVLPIHAARPMPAVHDVELEARLAFWFFHKKGEDFRTEVARSILSTCLVHAGAPLSQEDLLTRSLDLVGKRVQLKGQFRRQIKVFVADGLMIEEGGILRPAEELIQRAKAATVVQRTAENRLREDCVRVLEKRVHNEKRRQEAVDAVFDDLGFLLRRSLIERLPGSTTQNPEIRLNAIERRLSDLLKPGGGTVQEAIKDLIDVASKSTYGLALTSGELFLQWTERDSTEIAQALTGRKGVDVLLDATVAMPVLCSRFAGVVMGWNTSELAVDLYNSLRERNIRISVPNRYIEEMATHLIKATNYVSIIGEDPTAMARSENFFVAHYHAVTLAEGHDVTVAGFEEFLDDFGLPRGAENEEFVAKRAKVEKKLKELLRLYDMKVGYVTYTDASPLPEEPPRHPTVLKHDRCVAKWLDDRSRDESDEGLVLCTQDRWLSTAVAGRDWIAVDPAALVDLLQLVRPQGDSHSLVSVRELARRFDNDVNTRAAHVWDFLAELEGKKLADRRLLRLAKEFKDAWLHKECEKERPDSKEWLRFKGESAGEHSEES